MAGSDRDRRWLTVAESLSDTGVPWQAIITELDAATVLPPANHADTTVCDHCGGTLFPVRDSGPHGYTWGHDPTNPDADCT